MNYFICFLSLAFLCIPLESYDLSTWKQWQPTLSKYLGDKYNNFYRLGGSFPGPQELQKMIKEDVERLSRSNPKKGLEFYKAAEQISKKSAMPLFDARAIKQDIAREMKASTIKAMNGISAIANKRANEMLGNYSAYPEASNMVNAMVEKEIAEVREQMISDFENIDDLDPDALQRKISEMCALSQKFPSENEFAEICKKASAFGDAEGISNTSSRIMHDDYRRTSDKGISRVVIEGIGNQNGVGKNSSLNDDKSKSTVQRLSTGDQAKLEAKLDNHSQVDLEKISSIKLLYLNKDACNMMEIRPADQLSMDLCVKSNREISFRKRKDLRGWTKIVQEFSKQRELEFRKRLKSLKSTY